MASRVGTYLSDENIKRMCAAKFPPPAAKTYGLFKTPLAPVGYIGQRAQNPMKMMKMLSGLQGIPLEQLRESYVDGLRFIQNEGIAVVDRSDVLKNHISQALNRRAQVARPGPTGSKAVLLPTGSGSSTATGTSSTLSGQLLPNIFGGGAPAPSPAGPSGSGGAGSAQYQLFQRLNRKDQEQVFRGIFVDASSPSGFNINFRPTGLKVSDITGTNAGARLAFFGQLETAIIQAAGAQPAENLMDSYLGVVMSGMGGGPGGGVPTPVVAPSPQTLQQQSLLQGLQLRGAQGSGSMGAGPSGTTMSGAPTAQAPATTPPPSPPAPHDPDPGWKYTAKSSPMVQHPTAPIAPGTRKMGQSVGGSSYGAVGSVDAPYNPAKAAAAAAQMAAAQKLASKNVKGL